MSKQMRSGSCHCGAVKFKANVDLDEPMACNCSMCEKSGMLLKFIPAEEFEIVEGEDLLKDYLFNKKTIHHLFCPTCGVKPFCTSVWEGKDMVAVNIRCLDDVDLSDVKPKFFDGKSM